MAKKTMVELQAEITSLFVDNTTGSITPAQLRQFCSDFVTSMTPAYGGLAITGPLIQTFNNAPAVTTVWQNELTATAPEYTTTPATGTVTRSDGVCTNQITLNIDVELTVNRVIYATLYKNGVATAFRASATGRGAGNPSILSFDAIDYSAVPANYQIWCNTDASNTPVTFTNGVFLVRALPVRTA